MSSALGWRALTKIVDDEVARLDEACEHNAMAQRKTPTTSKVTRSTTTAPKLVQRADAPQITTEDIARLAYEKFVARGGAHGDDVSDWLAAEAELRAGDGFQ